MTEISISENFVKEYLPRATIEILPPLPCDNFYLPDPGRHVTSVHQGLSQAGAGEDPGYKVDLSHGLFFPILFPRSRSADELRHLWLNIERKS